VRHAFTALFESSLFIKTTMPSQLEMYSTQVKQTKKVPSMRFEEIMADGSIDSEAAVAIVDLMRKQLFGEDGFLVHIQKEIKRIL